MLDTLKTAEYARALYAAHGDKAEAEAAQKAVSAKNAGRRAEAEEWQAVRRAIRSIRGPNQG